MAWAGTGTASRPAAATPSRAAERRIRIDPPRGEQGETVSCLSLPTRDDRPAQPERGITRLPMIKCSAAEHSGSSGSRRGGPGDVHGGVGAAGGDQFVVWAGLDDPVVVDHDDP